MTAVSSRVTVGGFALASAGMVAVLYSSVYPFSYFGGRFGLSFGQGAIPGLLALIAGLVIASWSCLADAERRSKTRLHRLDWFFVLIVLIGVWTLVIGLLEAGRASIVQLPLAQFPVPSQLEWKNQPGADSVRWADTRPLATARPDRLAR